MKITPDPHSKFKQIFVKVVYDYIENPTDKKQVKLAKLVSESIKHDQELLLWFNAMFEWFNTKDGLDVKFRVELTLPFEG